jgi:hypothetical protein
MGTIPDISTPRQFEAAINIARCWSRWGRTHYTEIARDSATVYSATRSTGEIEEGLAGFSATNIGGEWKMGGRVNRSDIGHFRPGASPTVRHMA